MHFFSMELTSVAEIIGSLAEDVILTRFPLNLTVLYTYSLLSVSIELELSLLLYTVKVDSGLYDVVMNFGGALYSMFFYSGVYSVLGSKLIFCFFCLLVFCTMTVASSSGPNFISSSSSSVDRNAFG
jgi:hypothetical protein